MDFNKFLYKQNRSDVVNMHVTQNPIQAQQKPPDAIYILNFVD